MLSVWNKNSDVNSFFKHKDIWIIIVCSLLGPIVSNFFIWMPFPSLGTHSDWISFFGNYSGGIVGGIVAFIITKYQLHGQKLAESHRRFMLQHPALEKIKLELSTINQQLMSADIMYRALETITEWKGDRRHALIVIDPLNENYWSSIESITDIELQVALLKMKDFYNKFRSSLQYNIDEEQLKLDKLLTTMQKLNAKQRRNADEELALRGVCCEIVKTKPLVERCIGDKEHNWDVFYDEDYLSKIEVLVKRVDSLSDKVRTQSQKEFMVAE